MTLAAVFGAFFAVYAASSALLLKRPRWLHRVKPKRRVWPHQSHRGGAGEAPENTMTAFRKAVHVDKTDLIELDVSLTKDGEIVVAHDANLRRLADSDASIADVAFADLPPLKRVLPVDFCPGETFRCKNGDEEMAKLSQVFEAFPVTPVNIDIKVYDEALIEAVSDLVERFDRAEITVWGNFSSKTTERCYEANPEIPLFFSLRRVLVVLALFYTGLLPFVPLKESCFEIPLPSVMCSLKGVHPAWGVILDAILIRPALFKHLSDRGIPTFIWVLNTEAEFRLAFQAGAAGIMTDYPSKLRRFLDQNPQFPLC